MLLDALTGFAGGAAEQVVEISKDERKKLSEKLKMEALAEIDRLSQARQFGQQEKMAGIEQTGRTELEGLRTKNEGILESRRQENRLSLTEKEAGLRGKEAQREFLRRKEAGEFDKKPIVTGPQEQVFSQKGELIAENKNQRQTSGSKQTTDEKNYERFLSENPDYKGDFMQWKKSWSASDKTKMAYDLAQNDMRVMKSPDTIHEVAQEYMQRLGGGVKAAPQMGGDKGIDYYLKQGRALRGIK
jgi:hypothetical protein